MAKEFSTVPDALIEQGVANDVGFLSPAAYDLVTDLIPIVCVDVIPIGNRKLGTITRATGPEAGKLAIIGGRLQKNERVADAISRHLKSTIGDGQFAFHSINTEDHPFSVAQYVHGPRSDERGYDPTKHALAMTYLVKIDEPNPTNIGNEASSFQWLDIDAIPDSSAYNHHLVLKRAGEYIGNMGFLATA